MTPREDYTHVALTVAEADFAALSRRVRAKSALWQENASEGPSLYVLDPDGHRLELHVGTLASRLAHYRADGRTDVTVFDDEGATPTTVAPDPAGMLAASWDANAGAWADAVRSGAIASRRLVTDDAVLGAVLRHRPRRVLELGCGEGWLARALAPHVEAVVGLDGSAGLIARAQAGGGAAFHQARFADLIAAPARFGCGFDIIVANFALLDDALAPLLAALAAIAKPGGVLVIQTLHPPTQPPPYRDGWRCETFTGFGDHLWAPMPWYFRTLGSWLREVGQSWHVTAVDEPVHPTTGQPASLLIEAVQIGRSE